MELDKTNGYSTTADLPLIITKDNKEIMQWTFIKLADYYQGLIDELEKTDEIEILKDGKKWEYLYVL